MRDLGLAATAWGSYREQLKYDVRADMNYDNKIDMHDLATVAKHFGDHSP